MLACNTIADLIDQYTAEQKDELVLTFLDDSGEEKASFSFESLKNSCVTAARNLRLESRKQLPVLIMVEDQADFVLSFFGCVLAGFIPATLPPLRSRHDQQGLGRVLNILKQGFLKAIIVSEKDAVLMKSFLLDNELEALKVWTIESLKNPLSAAVDLPEIKPDDLAYIQFSSGSTATPSGVLLKHRHVIAQMAMMQEVFNRKTKPRVAGWIPFHHDMGLVGHLFTVLYEAGFGVFFPAPAFLARPQLWLDVLHKYRATAAAAPTFAFELCSRRITINPEWDLSCWEQAYVGSETVSYKILNDFAEKFAAVGFSKSTFRPVFGLAEATLLAAGGSLNLEQLEADILVRKVGEKDIRQLIPYTLEQGCEIRIKDSFSAAVLEEGMEGEIWIAGAPVPAAYLAASNDQRLEDGGVRTGDLGMIIGKNLYITGRKKEVVVIRGVNYSAEDLEASIRREDSLIRAHDRTACVSNIRDESEQLWVFQEVQRHLSEQEMKALFLQIQRSLSEDFGIIAGKVIFLAQGLMPKTANHKISRLQCEQLFSSGKLKALAVFPKADVDKNAPSETSKDRVVVVGMACRFPAGADSPEQFWELLASGGDAITEVPPERWDNELFYDQNASVPGKVSTKWAGFLDHIADFDPALFGVSSFEASEIDPQQRLLMETSWRLLEQVGLKKEAIAGSATGVFVGISTNDYLYMKIKLMPGMESFNAYSGLGNANSIAANRLSYFYDLKGPSMAVDTACSSSLTAFHLGVKAILNGDCTQSIVAGVNAILSPGPSITLSQFGMLSADGRCKAFDAEANGYVRSEGCGMVMLKLESAAIADGDKIWAIVDSTTLGQDGTSAGMTFPNGAAQHKLLQNSLEAAGLKGSDISYIEAHGTGTRAGDPVEMEQLRAIFGESAGNVCHVGSVKANVGHLEAAAGIASVMKTILMLDKKQIPPQIHLKTLNPQINLTHSRLNISTSLSNWESPGQARRAAINSFGFGGALANVILQEPEQTEHRTLRKGLGKTGFFQLPFVVSGHSAEALRAQISYLQDWLATDPEISWSDLCYTYAAGRSALSYKTYFLAYSLKNLRDKLASWLDLSPVIARDEPAGICFLFTGQGEHFLRMGNELYSQCPAFKEAFDRCAAAIDVPGQPALTELAFKRTETSHWRDEIMQPIHFALQYSLGVLWMECGISPQVLLGHSLGEYAAACLAGCFEPEEGMKILRLRGELVKSVPEKGFMATLFMNHEEVQSLINPALASIAAINSPVKTVISGHPEEVNRLLEICKSRGIETYFLKAEQAFHSAILDPMLEQFRKELSAFSFHPPRKRWISSLTGKLMTEAPDADYWVNHLRFTVQFAKAVDQLAVENELHFIEIGPGASTLAALRECTGSTKSMLLRSLTFKKGDRTESFYFLDSIGKLYAAGFPINWEQLLAGAFRPELVPGQLFMHQPYWLAGMDLSKFASHASGAADKKPFAVPTSGLQYKLLWNEAGALSELPTLEAGHQPGNWIVVGERTEMLESILSALQEAKYPTFWMATGSGEGRKIKPTVVLPDQAGKEEWHSALARIKDRESRADAVEWKIVFLDPVDKEQLFFRNNRGLEQLIPLTQAIHSTAMLTSLWVVSHDAHLVAANQSSPINMASAFTWGFGKTLFLEHPELRGGLIDLSESDEVSSRTADLIKKILTPGFERAVVIRSGRPYIQQLLSAPIAAAKPKSFRGDGVFIITGGLGGLGLKCAEWVCSKGARNLVLLSRRVLPDRSEWAGIKSDEACFAVVKQLMSLEDKGVTLEVLSLDVSSPEALRGLFDRLDRDKVPVRGVLHAAGLNWFSKILDLDQQRFFDTLKIKGAASWELHKHTASRDLDCFLLFSSVSAVWGSVDLSHYTAANQFMDALSIYRGQLGLPSLSIDWGPWAEVGMSSQSAEKTLLEKLGFALMAPDTALKAMDEALSASENLRLIADVKWNNFRPFIDFCLQPSLFANVSLLPEINRKTEERKIHARLKESSPEEAIVLIEQIIRAELRTVTLIESTDSIDADQRFNFMGLDSLMAISYVAKLENYFQLKLPSTLTYNYPTIRLLREHLFQLLYKPLDDLEVSVLQEEILIAVEAPIVEDQWFVPLNQNSSTGQRLYCFPFAGSGASAFASWSPLLKGELELIGIQSPGREERSEESPFTEMTVFIEELLRVFPEQNEPYYLFGHSLGALMAYEFAIALQDAGRKLPSGIIISGCNAPLRPSDGKIHLMDTDEFIEAVVSRFETHQSAEDRLFALRENHTALKADIELLETYVPANRSLFIPLRVICGTADPLVEPERMKEWISVAQSDFAISFVEGNHQLVHQNASELVQLIRQSMHLHPHLKLQSL